MIDTPWGVSTLCIANSRVDKVILGKVEEPRLKRERTFEKYIFDAFKDYLSGITNNLELPFDLSGTPFQIKVWNRLRTIPYGETITYGSIAKEIGTSARAVGNACRANPVPLIVPCHRVVGKNDIGGFMGDTQGAGAVNIKQAILMHEALPPLFFYKGGCARPIGCEPVIIIRNIFIAPLDPG